MAKLFARSDSISGTVGATTFTVAQMAAHTHNLNNVAILTSGTPVQHGSGQTSRHVNYGYNATTDTAGGSQSHNHSLSGTSRNASNLPPYYAISFIMRIA